MPTLTEYVFTFENDAKRESKFQTVTISSPLPPNPDDTREWDSLMNELRQFIATPTANALS